MLVKKLTKIIDKNYYLLLIFLSGIILLFFHTRGFPTEDEGWVLQLSKRLLEGEIPYKDFMWVYTPGVIYINSLGFFLLGQSVLASRMIAFMASVFSVLLMIQISKQLRFSKLTTSILTILFVFWGPAHVNFIWPVIFCLYSGIGLIYLELIRKKKSNKLLTDLLIGIVLGLNLLFKQNFGVALLAAYTVYILLIKELKNYSRIRNVLMGFVTIIGLQLLYLVATKSLSWFINDFYFFTVQKVFLEGVLKTRYPWQWGGSFLFNFVKTFIYLTPLLIPLILLIKHLRKPSPVLLIPLVAIFYYLLSIRPTTDYPHLTPLIAISTLSLVLIYKEYKSLLNWLAHLSIFMVMIFGIYSALFRNYYRWYEPLTKQNVYSNDPRIRIRIDPKMKNDLENVKNLYRSNAEIEEYTFVYTYDPSIYFILDKKNPTRYDCLHKGYLSSQIESEINQILYEENPKFITMQSKVNGDKTKIYKFIQSKYSVISESDNWRVLETN